MNEIVNASERKDMLDAGPPVAETLANVKATEDMDKSALMAMILNLQLEAMRRFKMKLEFGPEDVQAFGFICRVILPEDKRVPEFISARRRQ
jgi:hypothetical protein